MQQGQKGCFLRLPLARQRKCSWRATYACRMSLALSVLHVAENELVSHGSVIADEGGGAR